MIERQIMNYAKEKNTEKIINLDENVMLALDFFTENKPPTFDANKYKLPFVVGSGNAYSTGLILFSENAAIFADESNFKKTIASFDEAIKKNLIKDAIIISASGEKDSVWETELAKQHGLTTTLLTTKEQSEAAKIADEVKTYKSIAEPYTYNTVTYMGMILSKTQENPSAIKEHIESLEFPNGFGEFNGYSFVVPDKFMNICPMLDIKKSELFGSKLSVRAFPQGHARHAKFVIRSNDELVISLGQKNENYGNPENRWDIELSENADYAEVMALTYYIVGKIQGAKYPYFKENIENYTSDYGPKAYGSTTKHFETIVPGTEA